MKVDRTCLGYPTSNISWKIWFHLRFFSLPVALYSIYVGEISDYHSGIDVYSSLVE